jgi:hypothetical protein
MGDHLRFPAAVSFTTTCQITVRNDHSGPIKIRDNQPFLYNISCTTFRQFGLEEGRSKFFRKVSSIRIRVYLR